jgi:phospholipase/carboxylesterase
MRQAVAQGSTLQYLTLYPDDHADGADCPVIFCLHGFGADMTDLAGLAEALDPSGYVYVLPNAPLPAFDGADPTARAWYERGGNESPEAVREALAALDGLVSEVLRGLRVPAGQALLLGFSQGGALALRYGLPRPEAFAGLAVLSGSLRRVEDLRAGLPPTRKQRIFVGHGTRDPLVPLAWSRELVAFLEGQGYRPEYRTYPIGHTIGPRVVQDLRGWLAATLPPGVRAAGPG